MSNFKLEFQLTQHTPIIHFQSYQDGATLRATELKPKLDKFITKELESIEPELYEKYRDIINDDSIFPKDKGSNQYKVVIKSHKLNEFQYKTYLNSDERNNTNYKEGSYFGDFKAIEFSNISIKIISFNKILKELVEKVLKYVFVYENFGTRQTKGFGSFTIKDLSSEKNFKEILEIKYKTYYTKKSKEPLKTILEDYQLLKSGKRTINSNDYDRNKSKLFKYMCSKDIRWEKRKIKESMKADYPKIFKELQFENEPVRCDNETESFNYKYIRVLLGLAENNEYLSNNNGEKIIIKIKDKAEEIDPTNC